MDRLRTRWAAWILAASLLGPALYRPAAACEEVVGVGVGECGKPSHATRRRPPAPSIERSLFARVNAARSTRGLHPLRWDAHAARVARDHAKVMAREGKLHHNARLRTTRGRRGLGLPRNVGENVGVGPDGSGMHHAFMDSPGHRAQILASSFRVVGIGVVVMPYEVWVTELFIGSGGSRTMGRHRSTRSESPPTTGEPGAALPTPAMISAVGEPGGVMSSRDRGAGSPWLATMLSIAVGVGVMLRRRRLGRRWT